MCEYCKNAAYEDFKEVYVNETKPIIETIIPSDDDYVFEYLSYIEIGMDKWPNLVNEGQKVSRDNVGRLVDRETLFYNSTPIRFCPKCGRELISKENLEIEQKENEDFHKFLKEHFKKHKRKRLED